MTGEQMDLPGMPKDKHSAESIPEVAESNDPEPPWLGLTTDHRRLFDALQDGWLHPLPSNTGLLIGMGYHTPDQDTNRAKHSIPVRIKLDVAKLPELEVLVFHDERWTLSSLSALKPSGAALHWPGVLPTFAISELMVPTEEARARLTGMARRFSNVELPDVPVEVHAGCDDVLSGPALDPPSEATARLGIPPGVDSMHGAMTMAMWAVPHIDPWLDVLVASLSSNRAQLPSLAARVKAHWWRLPPWARAPVDSQALGQHDGLWLAAVDVFRDGPVNGPTPPRELAEQIAVAGARYGRPEDEVAAWLRDTLGILRTESTIQLDGWRDTPVGMAIQMVLTRPEPTTFKTWSRDLPGLPPAVWWSAATLCGLYHGYRRLDTRFRGSAEQREFLSVHAWRTCATECKEVRWPHLDMGELKWRREKDGFTLFRGKKNIAHKRNQARGKWYAADFDTMEVRDAAQALAKDLGWSCLEKTLKLPPGRLRVSGPGNVKVLDRALDIQGTVEIRLRPDSVIEDVLDVDSFRHHVVVAPGRFSEPPASQTRAISAEQHPDIPGLVYMRDFLSETEEQDLVRRIDLCDWNEELKRRVQHYGWRYDYKARQVSSDMRLGPLPEWADHIARRLVRKGLLSDAPDQVIVNEYVGKQGISKHIDSRSFADGIATISLLESWEMVFRKQDGKRQQSRQHSDGVRDMNMKPVRQRLDRRSAMIMTGDARYRWTHEIPAKENELVATEPDGGKPRRVKRNRRISLTFRKVIVPAAGGQQYG